MKTIIVVPRVVLTPSRLRFYRTSRDFQRHNGVLEVLVTVFSCCCCLVSRIHGWKMPTLIERALWSSRMHLPPNSSNKLVFVSYLDWLAPRCSRRVFFVSLPCKKAMQIAHQAWEMAPAYEWTGNGGRATILQMYKRNWRITHCSRVYGDAILRNREWTDWCPRWVIYSTNSRG